MVEITNFRQGAVLNHNHGCESNNALRVTIEGISSSGYPVYVNGVKAEMDGQHFEAEIDLTAKINVVKATSTTPYGTFSQELTLVWDKKSFKRYSCYIDDHSFLFTDLAKDRPRSAFDHFYLAGLKQIHDKYGLKVTLNTFYHNDHHDFELKDMPDIWRSEFMDNADWLKFSFHSYGEFPDRPYLETTAEEFGRDWDLVQNEIYRFAGEAAYIPPVVIHWANIHPVAAQEMIRRGTRCYSTSMRARVMGGPSLADRQKGGNMTTVQARSASGEDKACDTEALSMHYGFADESNYLKKHGVYYDAGLGLFFFGPCGKLGGCCCNLVPLADVPQRINSMLEGADKVGTEVFNYASHEQYTFPYYPNYLPDHMERIETAARCLVEGGCKAVFMNDGLMGNMAWEE
ncbi:MAG: hypothetical protein E7052_05400 [Lentisphaerae bacterium]|nr:hypothetical protein [Lentisphaerota bacterium]